MNFEKFSILTVFDPAQGLPVGILKRGQVPRLQVFFFFFWSISFWHPQKLCSKRRCHDLPIIQLAKNSWQFMLPKLMISCLFADKKAAWSAPILFGTLMGMSKIRLEWASQVAQWVKNPPAMQETQVQSHGLGIPWRRSWQPTPVFLPGESYGQWSLTNYSSQGCKELDLTEMTAHTHVCK